MIFLDCINRGIRTRSTRKQVRDSPARQAGPSRKAVAPIIHAAPSSFPYASGKATRQNATQPMLQSSQQLRAWTQVLAEATNGKTNEAAYKCDKDCSAQG